MWRAAKCRVIWTGAISAYSTRPCNAEQAWLDTLLDPSRQISQLIRCETITEEEVKRLCIKAREILIEEANVQVVDSPVTVRIFRPGMVIWPLILMFSMCIDMRRHTWAVLGHDGAFQSGRAVSRDELFIYGCVLCSVCLPTQQALDIIVYLFR